MKRKIPIVSSFSLQVKISIVIFIIMMTFSLIVAHKMNENINRQIVKITGNYIESIPSLINNAMYNFMLNGDRQSIKRLMIQLQDDKNIVGVHVFDKNWKLTQSLPDFLHKYPKKYLDNILEKRMENGFRQNTIDGKKVLSYYTPIYNATECQLCHLPSEGKILGHLNININMTYLTSILERDAAGVKKLLIISNIVLFILLVILVNILVIHPVRRLEHAMQEVANNNLDVRLDVNTEDEFGRMSRLFNFMVYSLRKSFTTISSIHKSMMHNDRLMTIGTLTAAVSHEIKNPLNSIMLNADIMTMKCPANKETAERIISDATRIKDIIDNTLNFSRLDCDIYNSSVDANKFLHDLCHYADRTLFKWTDIPFRTEIDQNLGYINASPVHLEQIFINILRNAAEAVEKQESPMIKLSAVRLKDSVVISIQDNGPGIPQNMQETIFNEFYTTKQTGTGIGLYIVKELAAKYNGSVSFESETDTGTVFKVTLPATDKPAQRY